MTENYGSSSGRSLKSYDWGRYFRMQGKKQEELKVAVQYAEGLRKIMVPVRIRCGLSGAVEQQDTPNKETRMNRQSIIVARFLLCAAAALGAAAWGRRQARRKKIR